MFLSKVILQTRHAAVYRLLSDIYRQHQFVMSAFPDRQSDRTDRNVSPQEARPSVLYRVESMENGNRVFLLVQSDVEPDWERTADLHPGTIQTACTKEREPKFASGQSLRFRLRANPTKMYVNGDITIRANHKRGGLYKEEEQRDWLLRHAERSGFTLVRDAILTVPLGVLQGQKPSSTGEGHGSTVKCLAVDFDGSLTIMDAEAFQTAFRTGIGRGKSWGCGLLSLAPV